MIDLENLTAEAVETVFGLISGSVALGSYLQSVKGQGSGDYDPATDTVAVPIAVVPNVRMLRVAASAEELVGTVVTVDDVKLIIPAVDLPNIDPSTSDSIQYPGTLYNITKIKVLPVSTLHILFCRAK